MLNDSGYLPALEEKAVLGNAELSEALWRTELEISAALCSYRNDLPSAL